MSSHLTFMMGKFAADFPVDRHYAKNHMWVQSVGPSVRCGFTAYAVRLLQDVYFLDWIVEAGSSVAEKQEIGQIESSKAESSLYSPGGGTLIEFNPQLLTDPSAINVDKYDTGWLFTLQSEKTDWLSPEKYIEHLESVWAVTQRTIKGQLNQ